ncbi:uncharacterized protein [Epargyreus clarus]|uniref:uncharacterized protein n=1 Tax=Epargyreus clarus TaxID=520877 RepID=UPI003C2F8696
MHRNNLYLSNLTFEIEVSMPRIIMRAESMILKQLNNDFNSSLPMYNKDQIEFELDNFRLQAQLQLKQSEDEKSILIEKIEDADFDVPTLKINLDEVIDENNLDAFSKIEEGLTDYIKDCKDIITKIITNAIITFGNPVLNQLDTWRYIAIL